MSSKASHVESPLPARRRGNVPPAVAAEGPASEKRRADLLAELGHTVRALRTTQGLSQQVLAERSGLSPRFVAQLEAGQGNISIAKLAELARALQVPPAALLHVAAEGPPRAEAVAEDATKAIAVRAEIAAELARRPLTELRALQAALQGAGDPARLAASGLVALVGLRGAGKSTLGPLLAHALGRPFVELDDEIQELTGLATSEIFELHGEGYYRQTERQALERLIARGTPVVLAVSGGAVTEPALFHLLREHALLVWVKASPEQHMQRVASQGDNRPMADRPHAMSELRDLLRARTPYYAQARLVADTSLVSPEACVRPLLAELQRLGA